MSEQVAVALIGAVSAVINTLLVAWLHARNHHEHRRIERAMAARTGNGSQL